MRHPQHPSGNAAPSGEPVPSWAPQRPEPIAATAPSRVVVPSRGLVPYLELTTGAVWWTAGAAALSGGPGTAVLAGGLGIAGALLLAIRRRHGAGARLPPGGRGKLWRLVAITVAVVVVGGIVLGATGWGELTVPLACAVVGAVLMPLSSLLDGRSVLATGAALMVLGAVGALLALDSAGRLYPQGVVGLVAGGLLWLAGAHRTGLLTEAWGRMRD